MSIMSFCIYYVIISQEEKSDAFSYYQFLVDLTLKVLDS
jgi:hypothetical protein